MKWNDALSLRRRIRFEYAMGKTEKKIAKLLGISRDMVQYHRNKAKPEIAVKAPNQP